jgi:hypothetical protein
MTRMDVPRTETLAGPRVRLGLSLAGVEVTPRQPGVRGLLEWAGDLGFESVAIDAANPETRPRLLDRSARRDLAAALRRSELSSAGVELWIPAAHLSDPARADHAAMALVAALELAAELAALTQGQPCLITTLRSEREEELSPVARSVLDLLVARATSVGAEIAEAGWPAIPSDAASPHGVALDPAAVIARGEDPVTALASLHGSGTLRAIRLNDLGRAGRVPVADGSGRLDAEAYAITAAALNVRQPFVLDLAGIDPETQESAARRAVERFGRRHG